MKVERSNLCEPSKQIFLLQDPPRFLENPRTFLLRTPNVLGGLAVVDVGDGSISDACKVRGDLGVPLSNMGRSNFKGGGVMTPQFNGCAANARTMILPSLFYLMTSEQHHYCLLTVNFRNLLIIIILLFTILNQGKEMM